MILYACQMNRDIDRKNYKEHLGPSFDRLRATDDRMIIVEDDKSVANSYNTVLDGLNEIPEALVFIHADCEIIDPAFPMKIRQAMAVPDVAVVGVIGATGVKSAAWWEGKGFGRAHHMPGEGGVYFQRGNFFVDAIDGQLIAFSPWACANLRFDVGYEEPGKFVAHLHDVDICFEARKRGKKVLVLDVEVRHWTRGGYGSKEVWDRADARFKKKWRL